LVVRANIAKNVQKIIDGDFDQDTVQLLLLNLRAHGPKSSLLMDIAHCVAHPGERDRGLCCDDVDFAVWKVSRVVRHQPIRPPLEIIDNTTWKRLLYGIRQTPHDNWDAQVCLTKDRARKALEGNYKKTKRKGTTLWKLRPIITSAERRVICSVEDVVFNVFCASPLITQDQVVAELEKRVVGLSLTGVDNTKWRERLHESACDLMCCVLCTLQHVRFDLGNGKIIGTRWSPNEIETMGILMDVTGLPKNATVCVPLADSIVRAEKYGISDLGPNDILAAERERSGTLRLVRLPPNK